MCRFTYGLSYEDFKVARKEARNFRDYFLKGREAFLEECKKTPQSHDEGPVLVGNEHEEDEEGEGGQDHNENNDSTISGQQEASRPGTPKVDRGSRKRNENQAAVKSRGRPRKKSKPVGQSVDTENDEPTGLSQPTEDFGFDD